MQRVDVRMDGICTLCDQILYVQQAVDNAGKVMLHDGLIQFNGPLDTQALLFSNFSDRGILLCKDTVVCMDGLDVADIVCTVTDAGVDESVNVMSEVPVAVPRAPTVDELLTQIDSVDLTIDSELTPDQQKIVRDFLKKNVDVFAPILKVRLLIAKSSIVLLLMMPCWSNSVLIVAVTMKRILYV